MNKPPLWQRALLVVLCLMWLFGDGVALFSGYVDTLDQVRPIVSAVFLVAAYAAIYRKRISGPGFWQVCAICFPVWYGYLLCVANPFYWDSSIPVYCAVSAFQDVAAFGMRVPVFVFLYRFAFQSRAMWSTAERPAAHVENPMTYRRILILAWLCLVLKGLPHLLLNLHMRALPFEVSLPNFKLVTQELTRAICLYMPLHQWTLILAILLFGRMLRFVSHKGAQLNGIKTAPLVLPFVLCFVLALHEINSFLVFVDDITPRRQISSSEWLKPLDPGTPKDHTNVLENIGTNTPTSQH